MDMKLIGDVAGIVLIAVVVANIVAYLLAKKTRIADRFSSQDLSLLIMALIVVAMMLNVYAMLLISRAMSLNIYAMSLLQ